jgi:hypothetical protein
MPAQSTHPKFKVQHCNLNVCMCGQGLLHTCGVSNCCVDANEVSLAIQQHTTTAEAAASAAAAAVKSSARKAAKQLGSRAVQGHASAQLQE